MIYFLLPQLCIRYFNNMIVELEIRLFKKQNSLKDDTNEKKTRPLLVHNLVYFKSPFNS